MVVFIILKLYWRYWDCFIITTFFCTKLSVSQLIFRMYNYIKYVKSANTCDILIRCEKYLVVVMCSEIINRRINFWINSSVMLVHFALYIYIYDCSFSRGHLDRDHMVDGFTNCAISTYHHLSNPARGEVSTIQHHVIKLIGDLRQVGGFLRFPPLLKLTAMIYVVEILLKVALNVITISTPFIS
jgi:hypothetical protein